MSIGKKIGGGFLGILILTVILGLWAIYSMSRGADVAEEIADDRLPRLIYWGNAQNEILEAAYYAKDYFDNGNEDSIKKTYEYFAQYQANLKDLSEINTKVHYENTAKTLQKAEKDIARYQNLIQKNEKLYQRAEDLLEEMIKAANIALDEFNRLMKAMDEALNNTIMNGDAREAAAYSKNIFAAHEIYARMSAIYQEMLTAERNNDFEAFKNIEGKISQVSKDAQSVNSGLSTVSGRKIFEDAMQAFKNFVSVSRQAIAALQEHLEMSEQCYSLFQEIYKDSIDIVNVTTDNSKNFAINAVSTLKNSTTFVSILLIVVIILGLCVTVIITRMIVRPLRATQVFARKVANGNLDEELYVHTADETGKLADDLRSMVDSLKQNINEAKLKSEQAQKATAEATAAMTHAKDAAHKAETAKREGILSAAAQLEGMADVISSASTELSSQIEQSDRSAAQAAQRLQEAATAMNEMNATVQEVARNASSASEASSDTRQKAETGQRVVQEVVQSIGEVERTSLQLKSDMAQLNERAQDINRIMGVISDIADQTNLLALNAAIEAARAGEAGRGFAVVADEVRKLAEKTMTSTLDVSNAIRAIQESTTNNMDAVDRAVSRISEATRLANQSGSALEDIVATVESTSDQVRAIAAASEEQSAASEEINRSITEVNNMARMSAEAMGQASHAVTDLASQAHRLASLILQMKNV